VSRRGTSYLLCALGALLTGLRAHAQAAEAMRQEVVLADSGLVGVTRSAGDTVVVTVRRGEVRVAVRVDSSAAATLADHSVRGMGQETATLAPLGTDTAGAARLDATDGVNTASVTFDAATARTMRRVLRGPLVRQSGSDWVETGLLYYLYEVETPAHEELRKSVSRAIPRYPDGLRNAGVSGMVVVQFVVDSAGRVRPETFSALRSSDPEFTAAVRDALPYTRYTPARLHGRPVDSMVEYPVQFVPPRGP
jgi:TonB family protein